jgi:hypothetical protein
VNIARYIDSEFDSKFDRKVTGTVTGIAKEVGGTCSILILVYYEPVSECPQ